jgi:hypothetical protein
LAHPRSYGLNSPKNMVILCHFFSEKAFVRFLTSFIFVAKQQIFNPPPQESSAVFCKQQGL